MQEILISEVLIISMLMPRSNRVPKSLDANFPLAANLIEILPADLCGFMQVIQCDGEGNVVLGSMIQVLNNHINSNVVVCELLEESKRDARLIRDVGDGNARNVVVERDATHEYLFHTIHLYDPGSGMITES